MELTPLHPPVEKRPLSRSTRGWIDSFHPLFSTQGHTRVRAHFNIADWLLMGGCLQSLVILATPLPLFYALAPTFGLAAFKITRLVLKIYGVLENPQMKNVRLGRQSAVFPPADGTMTRQVGEPVGGDELCVMILSSKCNQ